MEAVLKQGDKVTAEPFVQLTAEELENYKLHRRFDRMGRLVGDFGMKRLQDANVLVVGLGGVGSWAAESLVRSGLGHLTIIDFDQICITNTNRQLHAVGGLVGQYKTEVLAERFKKINPGSKIEAKTIFYNARTSDEILGGALGASEDSIVSANEANSSKSQGFDFVIDAIDNVTAKCHLLASCVKRGIPVVSSMGSGGRLDPTRVKVADLAETENDPLARSVRKILRGQYGFPDKGRFGIHAVFSPEDATMPFELHYDGGKGFRCVCPQGENDFHGCDQRNLIMGNASFVTGTFGFTCASVVVRELIGKQKDHATQSG